MGSSRSASTQSVLNERSDPQPVLQVVGGTLNGIVARAFGAIVVTSDLSNWFISRMLGRPFRGSIKPLAESKHPVLRA
jgi:hypothetical protein